MKHNFLTWLSQNTESVWWHDSANIFEQERAFSDGATGMTTNPFLVNQTLQAHPEIWKDLLARDISELSGDAKATSLIKTVTGYYAEKVKPLYAEGKFGSGFVCAQTNPNKTGDYMYMVEQAKLYATWYPNLVIKLPATNAGIRAYEECAALGYNVAATVSFTVPQVLAVAEAAERGKIRALANSIKPGLSIAVLMVGRLDDYLRDVAHDQDSLVTENDIKFAGIACIKRAYTIFNERGLDTVLMPAGCRGAHHITNLAGAKMIMSISPKIQDALLALEGPFEEKIDEPVDPSIIERLMTIQEFRKAYEIDGMKQEEFITFGSANRTTDQFINSGWNPLLSYKCW
jgi:transaldolase